MNRAILCYAYFINYKTLHTHKHSPVKLVISTSILYVGGVDLLNLVFYTR